MNVADALSRLLTDPQPEESFDDTDDKHLLFYLDSGSIDIQWNDIEKESEEDQELISVRTALLTGHWTDGLRAYESQAKYLHSLGASVFKGDRIVLPRVLRHKALESAHQGHIGIASMKRILRDYFWWPGISMDVEHFVEKCETCFRLSRKNPPIPLSTRALPQAPWEILQIDFYTDREFGHGEFLVIVDTYSRYLHVVEMRNTDADSTNDALNKVFAVWGLPLTIQSDNGPPFQSDKFVKTWTDKGVRIRKSIPLSAQSNGAVERQNKGIKEALAAAKLDKVHWKTALDKYVHVHNKVRSLSRLGVTPFELLVGWKFRGTFPCLWDPIASSELDREEVREKDALSKLNSKKYADPRRGAKESTISVGDKVVIAQQKRVKSDPTFSAERYTVVARDGAKIVVRSGRGVQYSRNVQDVKLASSIGEGLKQQDEHQLHESQDSEIQPAVSTQDIPTDAPDSSIQPASRPKRSVGKPSKFKDMVLYRVFE